MLKRLLQRQTAASFDYEWRLLREHMRTGRAPQEQWDAAVDRILTQQELGINPEWFRGRRVLDVGCGMGRWLSGFVKLGATVVGVDRSQTACDFLREKYRSVPNVHIVQADVFDLPSGLPADRFDLVFSWGVLHHTGDTRRAFDTVARLTAPDGVLYVFLYGRRSGSRLGNIAVEAIRLSLLPVPFRPKAAILKAAVGIDRATRGAFDHFSPIINSRHDYDEVSAWLREAGYTEVYRPYPEATQVFLRASRAQCSASSHFLPRPPRPYWWEGLDLRDLMRSEQR